MYLDDDPGVLISACLFGDGAGAAVLSRQPSTNVRALEWIDHTSPTLQCCNAARIRQSLQRLRVLRYTAGVN